MAATHRRRASTVFTWLLFIILIGRSVESQPPPAGSTNSTSDANNNNQYFAGHFNPYTVIIIVVLISAFFLLGFFSIYIRQCGNYQSNFPNNDATAAAIARLRFQRGLNREVLESFPTLVYSEVKEHKIGKGALECAICLNEFEDDETIRLLPQCDHVFHLDCIDAWLDTHVTCPVCRTNYADYSSTDFATRAHVGNDGSGVTTGPAAAVVNSDTPPVDHRVDLIDDMEERKVEMRELARIATRLRGNGARRSRRLSRSHSTGHSMMLNGEVGLDRYTLRLPENVRKEIIAAGKLKRAKTFGVIGAGDASMRRISRGGGEGSSRRGRTIRLGRSDRWPSFFGGAVSAKIPAWGNWRKGEEGSTSRKVSFSKPAADTFAGGAGGGSGGLRANNYDNSDESSTAALNRV